MIAVNATVMMTLGSIFISTFNSLPPSTYIKMIDVWMIVNLCYPVLVISLYVGYFQLKGSKAMYANFLKIILMFCLPLFYLVFTVSYWIQGLRIQHIIWNCILIVQLESWSFKVLSSDPTFPLLSDLPSTSNFQLFAPLNLRQDDWEVS